MPFTTIGLGTQDNDGTGSTAKAGGQLVNDLINATNYGQLQGYKNRLINGDFSVNQRGAASNADDTYCFDRWYVLTQTGAIAASALTDPETGAPTGIRLTQSQASAQRIGLAQIIESANCRDLRSMITTLSGRVRLSVSANIRYAVLEWTGAADSVTSDVVNDWTSSAYTAGNFFISSNVNVVAVGSVAATAATWRALADLNATLGASANNVIVFVWTESTLAQNGTLDMNRMQWEPGSISSTFETRPRSVVLLQCMRYYEKSFAPGTAPAQNVGANTGEIRQHSLVGNSTQFFFPTVRFLVAKRTTPTLTLFNPQAANAQIRNATAGADFSSSGATNITADSFQAFGTSPGSGAASGDSCYYHFTAGAEL